MKTVTLYSIGHGSRRAEELIALLTSAGVTTLVDVCAQPASARHPQFAMEPLRQALEKRYRLPLGRPALGWLPASPSRTRRTSHSN